MRLASIALEFRRECTYKRRRRPFVVNDAVTAAASSAIPLCAFDAGIALMMPVKSKVVTHERSCKGLTFWLHSQQLFATRAYFCVSVYLLASRIFDAIKSQFQGSRRSIPWVCVGTGEKLGLEGGSLLSSHPVSPVGQSGAFGTETLSYLGLGHRSFGHQAFARAIFIHDN